MTDYDALRKDFTNRRNLQPKTDGGRRLGILIVNCDILIKDPADEKCLAAFHRNARGLYAYEARRAGRA